MKKEDGIIIYEGCKYTFKEGTRKARVFVSEDERSCIVTDLDNDIQFEIRSTTICNSGFLKVV